MLPTNQIEEATSSDPVSPMNSHTLERACVLFLSGWTVRALAIRFKTPRSTVHYHLQKRLGKNCAEQRQRGSLAILQEHLQSNYLSKRQKAHIKQWINQHAADIVQVDCRHQGLRLLTAKQEQEFTRLECGTAADFRANLFAVDGSGQHAS